MTPNKERIKLWVEALRSGKYQQGHGQLRTKDNLYCCLGVACEIYHQQTNEGTWEPRIPDYRFDGHVGLLPPSVCEWFQVSDDPVAGDTTLTRLNDTAQMTFSEIADQIEQYLIKDNA